MMHEHEILHNILTTVDKMKLPLSESNHGSSRSLHLIHTAALVSRGQTAFFLLYSDFFSRPNIKEKNGLATRDYCCANQLRQVILNVKNGSSHDEE